MKRLRHRPGNEADRGSRRPLRSRPWSSPSVTGGTGPPLFQRARLVPDPGGSPSLDWRVELGLRGFEMRCWLRVILVAAALSAAGCAGRGSEPESVEDATTTAPSASDMASIAPETSPGDPGEGLSWLSTKVEEELVAFVGADRRRVVVGSTEGRIIGVVGFDVPVELGASPEVDRVAARESGGSTVWILDTSIGEVVEEFDELGDDNVVSSRDGRFRAEVVDGDIDGDGAVTVRQSVTGTQTFYSSTEPGWVLAEGGVAFARSSDLIAIPTSSTSSDAHALMVASAASGDLVAFSGAEPYRFLGWAGSSCWLSATADAVLTHCVDGDSIGSMMEMNSALLGGDLESVDPDYASIQPPGPLALSLPSPAGDDRRLVSVSPTAGLIEMGSGSYPRWSPSGRFLAVTTTTGLLVLDPDGAVIATYDGATGSTSLDNLNRVLNPLDDRTGRRRDQRVLLPRRPPGCHRQWRIDVGGRCSRARWSCRTRAVGRLVLRGRKLWCSSLRRSIVLSSSAVSTSVVRWPTRSSVGRCRRSRSESLTGTRRAGCMDVVH